MTSAPASCARSIRSPGSPRANDTNSGWIFSPRLNSAPRSSTRSSKYGTTKLIANGLSVNSLTEENCLSRSSAGRTKLIGSRPKVPMLPRPPALETAAARLAGAKGPIPAWMIGCSMHNSSQSAVRIILSSPTSQARIAAARALRFKERRGSRPLPQRTDATSRRARYRVTQRLGTLTATVGRGLSRRFEAPSLGGKAVG
jgi:hypothetical protein